MSSRLLLVLCQFCLRHALRSSLSIINWRKPSSADSLVLLQRPLESYDPRIRPAVLTGHRTLIWFPQPAQQAGETGVNLQDIRSDSPVLLLELESGPLGLVGETPQEWCFRPGCCPELSMGFSGEAAGSLSNMCKCTVALLPFWVSLKSNTGIKSS